jgi:hypothetical protein
VDDGVYVGRESNELLVRETEPTLGEITSEQVGLPPEGASQTSVSVSSATITHETDDLCACRPD